MLLWFIYSEPGKFTWIQSYHGTCNTRVLYFVMHVHLASLGYPDARRSWHSMWHSRVVTGKRWALAGIMRLGRNINDPYDVYINAGVRGSGGVAGAVAFNLA